MDLLVVPYENPDLDGTACAIAYAEFLRKRGKDAVAAIFGTPHREAMFVLREFAIAVPEDGMGISQAARRIALVDASTLRGLHSSLDPGKVVEVIDHRRMHDAHAFPNARIQVESVGAAATLVAERFHDSNTSISMEAAALLFSAIVSNTVDFKASVTTERDRAMADWLKSRFDLPKGHVRRMFEAKSAFAKPIKQIFLDDFAVFDLGGRRIGIAQLEMLGVDAFLRRSMQEIKDALQGLKEERAFDHIFLTCIDTGEAFNTFVAIDGKTEALLAEVLGVSFEKGVARRKGILMRKEIVPIMKEVLEKGG